MTVEVSEFYLFIRMAFTCGTMGIIVFGLMFALNVWGTNEERKARAERDKPINYDSYRFAPPPPRIEVHNHFYGAIDQPLEELEEIEWVRQLSRANAPKRIATNHRGNSKEY